MRVLVVEDEHKVANSVKKGLEEEGFAVDVEYNGNEGYDLASSEDYDVIVLDWLLPGMDGIEVCKKLRLNQIHTPILILTAKGQINERVEGLNGGADDYVVKPFVFEELLARIRALIRRPKSSIGSVLEFEDLRMDTIHFEVKRGETTLYLSNKEFSLLEYLLRHPNKILSKGQIIAHVWNYEANILPNTVEVYMGYLRNKIDKAFKDKQPLIHTARGFGYRIGDKK